MFDKGRISRACCPARALIILHFYFLFLFFFKRIPFSMMSDPFPMTAQRGRNSCSERNQTVLYIFMLLVK